MFNCNRKRLNILPESITLNKKLFFLFLVLSALLVLFYIHEDLDDVASTIYEYYSVDVTQQKYLINTEKCKIPDLPPITEEIQKYVLNVTGRICTDRELLSYIDYRDNIAYLVINEAVLKTYEGPIDCCVREIRRSNHLKNRDGAVRYSPCTSFKNEIQLKTNSSIGIICKNSKLKVVYKNVHPIILQPNATQNYTNKFSVLLLGIDSISRLNFMRNMPKTHNHVKKEYIELKGYNKVGDNTFPNLGGILSGMTKYRIQKACSYKTGYMDNCYFIWSDFKKMNYRTGYAEDEISISTFNLEGNGFLNPPTDIYLRPYMIAAENLGVKQKYGMNYCSGPEISGQRILNIAKLFAIKNVNVPSFGLFWMNTFSHDNINLVSTMDKNVYNLLNDTDFNKSIEHTFLIFLSDHGFRFGNIRFTYTGWLEERLPFIYIHVPKVFKERFPEKYKNLMDNQNKLTSPYDLFITLQHLLHLGDNSYAIKLSEACPRCISLFDVINTSRSCDDAGIDPHWCTCKGYHAISSRDPIVISVAQFVLNKINDILRSNSETSDCHIYKLDYVYSAAVTENFNKQNNSVKYFLVLVETKPAAMFEATVEMTSNQHGYLFNLSGEVSRLNKYSPHSQCMAPSDMQKYCYCKSRWHAFTERICSILRC